MVTDVNELGGAAQRVRKKLTSAAPLGIRIRLQERPEGEVPDECADGLLGARRQTARVEDDRSGPRLSRGARMGFPRRGGRPRITRIDADQPGSCHLSSSFTLGFICNPRLRWMTPISGALTFA